MSATLSTSPAAPRFANACEVTCPPLAVQPAFAIIHPTRADWHATGLGEMHLTNACFWRDRARNAERLGFSSHVKMLRTEMRWFARLALGCARTYRRKVTCR